MKRKHRNRLPAFGPRSASRVGADAAGAALPLPTHRPMHALHILQALLRFAVPVVGVLFFNLSAPQLILLYFVDTWLAFIVVFSLLILTFLPVRDWEVRSPIDWFTQMSGVVLSAMFVASFIMVTVAFPLIYVHHAMSLMEIIKNPSFQNAVMWHTIFSLTAFASQGWELAQVPDALATATVQPQLRRRFFLVFFRWLSVYLLMFVPFIQFIGVHWISILYVVVYSAFGFAMEVFPRAFEKILQQAERDRPV